MDNNDDEKPYFHPSHEYSEILTTGLDVSNRRIYLTGQIDENASYKLITALDYLDRTEGDIVIIMNSTGGAEDDGYAIYDKLLLTSNKVIIEAYGMVGSIAAAIFQAGDDRRIAPNCDMLIHNGLIVTNKEEMQQDTVINIAEQLLKARYRYYDILASRSNLTVEEIEEFCKAEKIFSSKEAVKYKLADRVITRRNVKKCG